MTSNGVVGLIVDTPNWGKSVAIEDPTTFAPPAAGTVERGFEPQHWGVSEMLLLDPDRRSISIQGPLPDGVEAPEGHG